ncbi:MAG: DUF2141 domain-containing protein [Parvularcula sp.]|jgi:uncharacterized protein (DUF2141 family)|nr:DUF2141 domain-containing protein [Parvularcula sp.]
MFRISLSVLAVAFSTAHAAELAVTLNGVEEHDGTLYVSVQNESEFMGNRGTAGEMSANVKAGTAQYSFDVPEGRYAVSVWHDINANGVFDMGEDGMPLDGWAMSAENLRGEPTFDEAAVEVGPKGAAITLQMTY